MSATACVADARTVFGADLLAADELAAAFGAHLESVPDIPFSVAELQRAQASGEMLVLRAAHAAGTPLTIVELIRRFPDAFDTRLLEKAGYMLKGEWGIALEPLAASETCSTGWALVRKEILAETRNLPYDEQEPALHAYAQQLGAAKALRRRTAVEAVFDTVFHFAARRVRLLEQSWDWTASRTIDAGYLNVGGFGAAGLQVLSFSRAIRHGGLGVCPTRQPNRRA